MRYILVLLLLCCLSCTPKQVVAQDLTQLTSLSSEMRSALLDSKTQTLLLENKLNLLEARLLDSERSLNQASMTLERQLTLSALELTELSTSLKNTRDSYLKLSKSYNESLIKLKSKNNIIFGFIVAAALILLCKVVALILYKYGVKTPRWLDIIL